MGRRGVIFDLDETLITQTATGWASLRQAAQLAKNMDAERLAVATLIAARAAWRSGPHYEVAVDLGIASWDGLWSRFEGCHPRLDGLAAWSSTYRDDVWRTATASLGLDDPELASAMGRVFEESQRCGFPLIEGVAEVVTELGSQHRLGLLTNGPADIQRLKLHRAHLSHHFDAVVISGELGVGKPAAAAFQQVLEGLELAADEAVMVGDSWDRDIRGALRFGISPIWVSGGRQPPEENLDVRIIESLQALPDVLRAM